MSSNAGYGLVSFYNMHLITLKRAICVKSKNNTKIHGSHIHFF